MRTQLIIDRLRRGYTVEQVVHVDHVALAGRWHGEADRRRDTGAAASASHTTRAAHAARGVAIDATTASPRRDGTPLDAHLAVQALLAAAHADATHDS